MVVEFTIAFFNGLLSVSSAAPEAKRLYERTGFQVWGTQPEALRHDGRSVVEHYMALQLKSPM